MAYSTAINLTGQIISQVRLGMGRSLDKELPPEMNAKQLEKLALDIANKKYPYAVIT